MAMNANLLSVSSNDQVAFTNQNSSKPNSANLKISIPVRQRKDSFESDTSTVDSYHMSVSDDLSTSSYHLEELLALSPRSRLARGLVSEYGCQIDSYLRKIEKDNQLKADHLARHQVKSAFRAKMVDWMVEVLNIAFSNICGDQTLFLAVSIMDRYIQALEVRGEVFKTSELHITGVTCMFIASKYYDIQALLLKTVFNKIGHTKIPQEAIIATEMKILLALGFKIGAPTPLEFLTATMECIPQLRDHPDRNLLEMTAIYLAKMSLHHESLYVKAPSMIASTSIFVANKIYEQMLVISGKQSPVKNHLSERFLLETLSCDLSHYS